jgi:uncharacterized protein YegP (UPF0339 family)
VAHFAIRRTGNQQYIFNLHATNGEIILTSETYVSKQGAQNGIASVKTNAPNDDRYDRKSSGQQFDFVLRASNNDNHRPIKSSVALAASQPRPISAVAFYGATKR